MRKRKRSRLRRLNRYANDTTAYNPEVWAQESIMVLNEHMKFPFTVHTDFNKEIASQGDTVHTREPGEFYADRKQNDVDTLNIQPLSARKVQVNLNQRAYVSYILGNKAHTLSMKNLLELYIEPAAIAIARQIDTVVGGQAYQFLDNSAGGLGQLTSANASDYLLDARQVMNNNKVSDTGRWMGLASGTETEMQKVDLFKSAERVGDGGLALQQALLGRKHGFDTFLELNTPSVSNAATRTATTTTAEVAAGSTVIPVTSVANISVGDYLVCVGDYTPLRVVSIASLNVTVNRATKKVIASGASVQSTLAGKINQTSAINAGDSTLAVSDGYPAGWIGQMVVDTAIPQTGQMCSFVTSGGTVQTQEYCIVNVNDLGGGDYGITLDQPLAEAIDNNGVVGLGPSGDYNFGYQRNALTLVSRPLELPDPSLVRSARAMMANIGLSVTIGYNVPNESTQVTLSVLYGTRVLKNARGVVLLG